MVRHGLPPFPTVRTMVAILTLLATASIVPFPWGVLVLLAMLRPLGRWVSR